MGEAPLIIGSFALDLSIPWTAWTAGG